MADAKPRFVLDGPYENVFMNVGTSKDRSAFTRPVSRRRFNQTELENLYEFDGFARRIVDLPAEEMMRAGFTIEGMEDNEQEMQSDFEGLELGPVFTRALRWSELFGGAIVVMLINDGGTLESPLNPASVRSIEQLRVYDRWRATRHQLYRDPADKRFGQTEIWQINPVSGIPYLVHESRCMIFDGMDVPDNVREVNDGWGGSVLQHCYDQLTRFNMAQYWANALLERSQQGVHGIPGLTDLLRTPDGEALVKKRINLVDMARSVNNTVVIDAQETYELKSTPFSGVSDIMDRMGLSLSSVSGIPESLLFGRQQGGLNSTGKSDLENWYARIGQKQSVRVRPNLVRFLTLYLAGKGERTDEQEYTIEFNPLTVPSEKDNAETEYKRAQTREIYYNMQALDGKEVRTMLDAEGYPIEDVEKVPEGSDPEDVKPNAEKAAPGATEQG